MDPIQNKKFAEFLIKEGIGDKELAPYLERANKDGKSLFDVISAAQIMPENTLIGLKAGYYKMPRVNLTNYSIPQSLLQLIPYSVAMRQRSIVFERDGALHVAVSHPENRDIISFLEKKTGMPVTPYLASESEIDESLNLYSHETGREFTQIYESIFHEKLPQDWATAIEKIVDAIIHYAKQQKASDIHIEPRQFDVRIRFRIDGVLYDIASVPKTIEELVITRIKVMANLRTDEHSSAQDGRFKFISQDQEFTIRVSILPAYEGEKVVMRLLTSLERNIDLVSLGFSESDIVKIQRNYTKPHGMILVTGPTGCGKTTTLYSILADLNTDKVNITTVEDPIEYKFEGINQVQVNPNSNLTFATGLRAILRQDPNIIMVGEIRDEETASIAINAALTGHLVLSTLHTNSAATTLPRLMEMGIEPFLVASTVNVVLAQRLVRKLCPKCKVSREPSAEEKRILADEKFSGVIGFPGEGCEYCSKTAYLGRIAIAEVLEVTDVIRDGIIKKLTPRELEKLAISEGMEVLYQDGLNKVKQGITSLSEVLRVCIE